MNPIPTRENIDTCVESRDKLEREGKRHRYRKQILEFISEKGVNGATCDEVETSMGLRHQTASCFIRFLTQDGFLQDSGNRRMTRAGRKAIVWVATFLRPVEYVTEPTGQISFV